MSGETFLRSWRRIMRTGKRWLGLFFFLVFALSMQAQPPNSADEATRRLAVDIFKQLIEINTTDSVGRVTFRCWDQIPMSGKRTSWCDCMDRGSTGQCC